MRVSGQIAEYMKNRAMIELDEDAAIDYEIFNCQRNLEALAEQFGNKRAKLLAESMCELDEFCKIKKTH